MLRWVLKTLRDQAVDIRLSGLPLMVIEISTRSPTVAPAALGCEGAIPLAYTEDMTHSKCGA